MSRKPSVAKAPESIDMRHSNAYSKGVMDVIPIKPEGKAQLEEYARRRGQDTSAALDDALAEYLEWEQDYEESAAAIRRSYEDVRAGRTRSATEFLEELRVKHGFPR